MRKLSGHCTLAYSLSSTYRKKSDGSLSKIQKTISQTLYSTFEQIVITSSHFFSLLTAVGWLLGQWRLSTRATTRREVSMDALPDSTPGTDHWTSAPRYLRWYGFIFLILSIFTDIFGSWSLSFFLTLFKFIFISLPLLTSPSLPLFLLIAQTSLFPFLRYGPAWIPRSCSIACCCAGRDMTRSMVMWNASAHPPVASTSVRPATLVTALSLSATRPHPGLTTALETNGGLPGQ